MSDSKEEFQSELGNSNVNPMSDKLKLLFEYMEKETELNRQFDKEDGIDVDAPDYTPECTTLTRVLSFERYRRAYTETMYQDFLVKAGFKKNPSLTEELDRNQRQAHNSALSHLLGFKNLSKTLGLEPLYKGAEVSKESIRGMGSDHSDARKEMTDFFLKLITELSDYNIQEIENKYLKENTQSIKDTIRKDNHDFRVKDDGLTEYHGKIEFEDENDMNI